jgi:hypothetical protein
MAKGPKQRFNRNAGYLLVGGCPRRYVQHSAFLY